MNTTAESTFLASSFLEIRLQGSRLPAQPAQLRNVNLQAPREGSSVGATPPLPAPAGATAAPSHSELSSNVTSSGRPSLTTPYELAHLPAVYFSHSI